MKLPGHTRIYKTDFPQDDQVLVEKLADIINGNIQALYELGNKKTSLRDNIACTIKDVVLAVDASGTPTAISSIALDTITRVEGITVISAISVNNTNVYPTAQPFIAFTPGQSSVTIDRVMGLVPGHQWRLRVIVWQM